MWRLAAILMMAHIVNASVDIPDDLKRGKMNQYAACRKLFAQNIESFAVVSENAGQFEKVCNCSFHQNPPQSGLKIKCHYAREVVIPITIDMYQLLGQVTYFIVRYRIRGSSGEWQEERIDISGSPQARLLLDLEYNGSENIYEVEIYATLSDGTRKLIMSDQLSSTSGRSVLPQGGQLQPAVVEREYAQATQSFRMNFDRITDNSMEITFETESPLAFKLEYINGGRRLDVDLNALGQATLTGLEADTEYVFIISYNRDGEWVEMRRKPVRTMSARTFQPGSYTPTFNYGSQDITLKCPVVVDDDLQTVNWYKMRSDGIPELLAAYDAESGTTNYARNRDPKMEVIDGVVLRINDASQEHAGHYRCRYSVVGSGYTWQSAVETELVTLYITWETQPGIVAYYIQYRPYHTTHQWETITLRDADRPSTIVRGLQPVTQYEFKVYDYSGGVRGDLLDTIVKTTQVTSDEGPIDDPCAQFRCGRGVCDPRPRPHCVCDYGYTGSDCNTILNYCEPNQCLNGGICNPLSNGYACQCLSGYSGRNCERERTACNPNPCRNHGVCVSEHNEYICRCRRGYRGLQCELADRSSPCDSRPCVHGSCTVLGSNYHCECERGYLGRNCDQVDSAPSILLRCPVQEDVYGRPELVQWVRISPSGRRERIYRYDVANQRRAEGTILQYRGRLYSPNMEELIIRDSRPSDITTYQCIVSYKSTRITSSAMKLVKAPTDDDSTITVTWRPSRLLIDHYDVKYRNVEGDEAWVEVQIPSTSRRYTLNRLEPGGVYEISVVPYTQPDEVNQPVDLTVLSSVPTTTTAATTASTTTVPVVIGLEKSMKEIPVSVSGPRSPVEIGSTAYLTCSYPTYGSYKPTIRWKKIVGDRAIFLYNEKMPPLPSRRRIAMSDERRLRINNFQRDDAGTYECRVEFETALSFNVGSGSEDVEVAEMTEVPTPTNLIIDVTGPSTALLTWQPSRHRGVTGYVVRYFPTTRRFGEYERRETTLPRIILENLVENNEYNVEIRATGERGYSEPLEGHFEQAVERIPSPTNFQAQMLSPTRAKIMWEQPNVDGLTGYRVQYWDVSKPAAGNLIKRTSRPGDTEMILSNLIDGTVYQVWVKATKGDSLSPQLSGQFTKSSPVMPNAPALLRFKNIEKDRATAYWGTPVGWTPADKYRVSVKSMDSDFPFLKTFPDSAPSMLTVSSLHPGVVYIFTLNTVRNGVLSRPVYGSVKTTEVITLTAPYPEEVVLECKTRTPTKVYQVKWYKINSSGVAQLIFTTYSTSTRNEATPNRRDKQFVGRLSAPSTTSLAISNVRHPIDFGKYKCIASAAGNTGRNTIELIAEAPTIIAPPEDFEFDVIDSSTAKITWRHPYADDISSYVVKYRPTSSQSAPEKILETSKTEAPLSNLTAGEDYEIKIKAKINNRESKDSLIGSMPFGKIERISERVPPGNLERIPGIAVPSPISNLRVEALGPASLSAIWDPTPDVHFDFYRVLVTNTRTSHEERFNTTNPTIRITQLQRYQTFDVAVSTVRNGAFSTPVVATVALRDVIEETPSREFEPGEEETEFEAVELTPAPTNLRFHSIMRTRFTVSWDSSDENIRDYEVKSRPTVGSSRWRTVRTRGYPTITLRGLRSGTEYEVQIYSILVTGQKSKPLIGRQSTQREIRLVAPKVTVFDKTNDSFSLRWSPLDAEHRVYVYPIGVSGQRQILDVERGETSVVVRDLDAGRKYRAAVTAMSGGRRSALTYVYPTTNPNQPTDLQVINLGSDSMVIAWTEPVSTLTTGYRVIYYPTATNDMEFLQATSNRAEINGLEPETEYAIEVQTEQGGELSAKTTTTVTTKPETIAAPGNAEVTISGDDILVRWSPVPGAQAYEISHRPEDDTSAVETYRVESPTSSHRITDVLPGHYIVKVAAVKDDQLSPTIDKSITMSVKPPRNLRVSGIGRNEVTATWDAPQNVGFIPIYNVIALPNSLHSPLELPSEKRTRETTYTFQRLSSNTEYRVEVITRYGNFKSAPATTIFTTDSLSPPDQITSDATNAEITVRWTPVDGVDNYEVTYFPVGDASNPAVVTIPSDTTDYTFSSGGPGQYEIRVVAVKNGERSQPTKTRQQAGVESPGDIRFSDVTHDTIIVEWTPPRTRARYDYEVTLISADDVTRPSVVRTTQQNWQRFTDLEPATSYYVQIKTLFGDIASEPVTASITTGVPVVRRVEAPLITDGNLPVEVVWQAVPDADSYIVTYYSVDGDSRQEVTVRGERNSVTLTDLQPETEYVVEVTSVINSVRGNPTALSFNTRPVGAPERIETQPSDGVVRVVWQPVDNVDHYEVVYYPVGDRRNAVTEVTTSPSYSITGVEPGEYEITVTAVKSDHRSQPTRVVQRIGVIPPTDIDFTDATEDEFIVVWSPSRTRDVVKYVVRASSEHDLNQSPDVQETSDTFARFEDLLPGTTYLVEITAETPNQRSKPLIGRVTTGVPNPSNVRENIPTEEGSVEIIWNPVPSADSYEVTFYPVGGDHQIVIVGGDESGTILSDLEPGTEYVVQVRAIVNNAVSAPTELELTTPLKKPNRPDAQPLSENSIPSPTSVQISWEPNNAAPEYEIKYYKVIRDGSEVVYGQPQTVRVPGSSGKTVLTGLLPGTEYIVEVKAVDGTKTSRPETVEVTTPLDKPTRIETQEPGEEEVTITWQHPAGEVTEYIVKLIPTDGSQAIMIPVRPEENSVTATGLQPGTEYEVRVVSVNSDKRVESQPGIGFVRTKPADIKPVHVQLHEEPSGSYTITWDAPARPVQNYVVKWTSTSGSPTEHTLKVPGNQHSVSIPQLLPDTDYEIVIQAINKPSDALTDYNSIIESIKTNIPGLPDSITTSDVSDNTVVVQWEHPTQDTFLTGYRVEVYPEGSDTPSRVIDVSRTTNRVTLTGLKPSTSYSVKVTPHINLKPGEPATQTVVTDEIRTIPVPDYVTVPEVTSQDIVIQWGPPVNHEYITKYNIVVNDENGNTVLNEDVPRDTYTYTLSNLRPGAHYTVYVRSYVDDRPSEPAEDIATTLPAQPEGVRSSNVMSNQFELSWTPSEGDVISYLVNVEPQDSSSAQELFFEVERPSILIPNVEPDTTYDVEVITLGPGNLESTPATLSVTTGTAPEERTPPPEVRPEESINVLPGQPEIVIKWEMLPKDQPVQSYQIVYRVHGSDDTKIITVPSGVSEIILSSLEPREQYEVWVRALLDTGEHLPVRVTDQHTVTIVPSENYTPLTEAPIVAPEDGKMSIIWENLGSTVTEYGVTYGKPDSEEPFQVVVPGTYSGTFLSGLTPGDEYVINVIGVKNGRPITVGNVKVGGTGLAPDETSVSAATPTGVIKLQWLPVNDDDDEDKVIGYQITYNRQCCLGEPDVSWVPGKDSNEATVELEPNTEYVFTVVATTSGGQNKPIDSVQVTTVDKNTISPVEKVPEDHVLSETIHRPGNEEDEGALPEREKFPTNPGDHDEDEVTANTTTTRRPVVIVTRPRLRPTSASPEPLGNRLRSTTTEPSPRRIQTTKSTTTTTPKTRSTTRETPEVTDDADSITPENGHVTISWEPFFGDNEDGKYRVIITRPDRPDDVREAVLPGNADTVTVTSLQPNVKYNVFVQASPGDDFEMPFQIPITIYEDKVPRRLHPYEYLLKPTITSIEPYGEDTTIVNWVNPTNQQRSVTHYVLKFTPKRPTETSQTVRVEIPANKERTSHVVTGLLPNVEYIVTLQAANEPTKTRSATEKQDFVTGTINIVATTTQRTYRPRTTTTQRTYRPRTTTTQRTHRPRTTTPTLATKSTEAYRPRTATSTVAARSTTEQAPLRPASRVVVPSPSTSRRPYPAFTETPRAPQEGGDKENTTPKTTAVDNLAGVDALPTYDGRIIINWTPVTTPVDNYIIEYRPKDGSSPGQKITIPGDTTWTNIPEPTSQPGYVITIYTEYDGITEPLYDIQLGKSPDSGKYHLRYGQVPGSKPGTTITTQEVYIPATRTEVNLPGNEYSLGSENEIENWLRPVTFPERPVGGPSSVTLRWNPESTTNITRVGTYRIELVPIDSPNSRTIIKRVRSDSPANIKGLQPGVSYRLYARYIQSDGGHTPRDEANSFVIPAFSRFGVPIAERRFGINEVWIKELRSGELLLQWDEYPGATAYTIEYQDSPDGVLHTSNHNTENRWIVLPHLEPGGSYTIHIYVTVEGQSTKIYTVTVRRKITVPSPPLKVEWYNMLGHSVDLSWLPPQSRITGYRITYYLGTTEDREREFVIDTPANVTTFTLRDLIPGETYTVIIQTLRGEEISRELSFPLKMVVPTVRRLYFQQTEPQVVVIRWDSLPDYVTGYLIGVKQVSPPGPNLVPDTVLAPDQSEYTIKGVKPGVRYEFTIRTMIGDKTSEPVILHLWTLRAESRLSRVEQTGTWTVSWSGNPHEVDYWKIEVKRPGSATPIFSDDNVSRFRTSYQIRNLTPGVEYIIYIYGVKNNVSSTPIQIRIPANLDVLVQTNEVSHRRQQIYPSGPQLVSRFTIKAKPNQIEIGLIPQTVVDRYIIRYKKGSETAYTSRGVTVTPGDGQDTAVIRNLEPGTSYNFSITAIRGEDRSEMNLNVRTQVRRVIKPPLHPLQNIRRHVDPNPDATGFYIQWDAPRVSIRHYTVTYNYTEMEEPVEVILEEPTIYVPHISKGHLATYSISYTARDGRQSPKSVMTISFRTSVSDHPKFPRREGPDYEYEEQEEDIEQP